MAPYRESGEEGRAMVASSWTEALLSRRHLKAEGEAGKPRGDS